MFAWLKEITNPSFMPHGHCYLWKPEILWTHVISDLVIGLAYLAIPTLLGIYLYKSKNKIPYPTIVGLFCAFILFCGLTHFFSIVVTWHPLYEAQSWLKSVTAIISIYTAAVLAPKLPELMALPDLKEAYQDTQNALNSLQDKNRELQSFYEISMDREERILALKKEVNELLNQQSKPSRYTID